MKNLILPLLMSVFWIASCKNEKKVVTVITSDDYQKGEQFIDKKNDSAFYYFNKVVNVSKDNYQIAIAYNRMALLQLGAGDYYGSQESVLASLPFLDEKKELDQYCLSSNYNILGNDALNLKNYSAAVEYYEKAIQFTANDQYKTIFLNNKALAFQKKKEYEAAIKLYATILEKSKGDALSYARVRSNLARTRWLKDAAYNPSDEFFAALSVRRKQQDLWGMNASYAHLSDYYAESRPDSARYYAEQMYQVAVKLESPDDQLEALQKLIKSGSGDRVRVYFDRYQQLGDSLQEARNAAKNQFALIRYEAAKTKADNLELHRNNAQQELRIIKQRIILYLIILLTVALALWGFLWYKKRKRRLEEVARNAVRDTQLKTSQKVHDVVANGLYRIMTELEHNQEMDKEVLIDKIDQLYERSRDISYEDKPIEERFSEKLDNLINTFANPENRIVIAGNEEELWQLVSLQVKNEIIYIFQELMINMSKHSGANSVALRFSKETDTLSIQYKDNGKGFDKGLEYGNGLRNTENRIRGLGGAITFTTNKGLQVNITIPL